MKVFQRAPGKVILIGEHAVVYGYPAVVASLDYYATAQIEDFEDDKVRFELTRFHYEKEYTWKDIWQAYERGEENVRKFHETGERKYLERLKETSTLPKFALIEVLKYAGITNPPGIILAGDSQVPIGGFGASSAVGGAVIKAFSEFLKLDYKEEDFIEILMRTETMLHGYRPSGLDQNAVIRKGLIQVEFEEDVTLSLSKGGERKLKSKKLDLKTNLLDDVLIIQSGKPINGTGEVVEMVRKRKSFEPDTINTIFGAITEQTKNFVTSLEKNDKEMFYKSIDISGEELIKLGIVTKHTQKLITQIKELGGHVKISGAGAISGRGSGALICVSDNQGEIEKLLKKKRLEFFRKKIG